MNRLHWPIPLIVFLIWCNQTLAGWVIVVRHNTPEGLIIYESLTIDGKFIKSASLNGTFIINLETGVFKMVSQREMACWQGNVEDFRAEMDSAMHNVVETFLKGLPEKQKELYSPVIDGMKAMFGAVSGEKLDSLRITFEKTTEKADIAGFRCDKYIVLVDGRQTEEVWVAPSLVLSDSFDGEAVARCFNQVKPLFQGEIPYDRADAYLKIWDKGFRMKSIALGGKSSEVIKVSEQVVEKSEFEIPEGFRLLTAREIITKQLFFGDSDNTDK